MQPPKLRDSIKIIDTEPYPLNDIPEDVITKIGAYLVYLVRVGRKEITGSDWGDIFASSIVGRHLDSPCGIADVVYKNMAWSMKTVKNNKPFSVKNIRLISGRCSPDYSYGITDPHKDLNKTGQAVLSIWNQRVNIAQQQYSPLRVGVLIRSYDLKEYCFYEEECIRYGITDYEWVPNRNNNLIGISKNTGEECFTWQPHGSQLTIHSKVPKTAIKFSIRLPQKITREELLKELKFDSSWVSIDRD